MGLFDIIRRYLTKKGVNLIADDFTKTIGDPTPLSIALYNDDKTPITGKEVQIEINGVEYNRKTGEDGIAKLNINLPVGIYDCHVVFDDPEYHYTRTFLRVTVCPVIKTADLNMVEGDGSRFIAVTEDMNGYRIGGVKITFNINGVNYERTTDNNGIASLPINLQAGDYKIITKCHDLAFENHIHIDKAPKKQTRMEGTDINMTYKDGSKYQCAVYDDVGRVSGNVRISVNGVSYDRTPDGEGLYKLAINLNPGTYKVKAEYLGDDTHLASSVNNTIVVNEAPKPTPTPTGCTKPYTSSPHPTNSGCNGMGQNNSVCCGPSSLHKALYKFGIRDITQGQLSSWAGTSSGGTSHQGLETAIAKVNQVKGTNISIRWYNKSDLTWEEIGKILCQSNKAIFCHILYKNGGTCDGSGNYGHYELLTKVNTDTGYVKVLNSLGGYCGSCYCGFYQDRTMACQEQFMRGISQKSIAVLTKH